MIRQIPGLHASQPVNKKSLDGLFLVRVDRAYLHWQSRKPFLELRFVVVEPKVAQKMDFSGRLYCTEKALWKFSWFLRDFGYDSELLSHDQVDVKALLNLQGVIRTSHSLVNGRSYQNLDAFASAAEWEALSCTYVDVTEGHGEEK